VGLAAPRHAMASDFGIGARLPRLEDARFLEGRGQFCADIKLPGTLHAAFVRSPHAHARILAVRKPRRLENSIFLAGDLTGVGRMRSTAKLPGFKPSDWPILAAGKVRHVGEPIAMALGSTRAEAEDFAALVEVDFEPLPPVVTVADALKKAPPFVHDEWGDNVLVDIKLEAGDLNAAKSAAAHVVERKFRMNRMHPLPLEGRACIAAYDDRLDELVVYVAHQLPVPLQIGLAQVLGISQRRLRVVVPDVGASFGLKTYVESETVCVAWAAMRLRRPVRWIQDRYESLVCDATCRDYECKVIGYADAQGVCLVWNATSPWIRARIRRGRGPPESKAASRSATCRAVTTSAPFAAAPSTSSATSPPASRSAVWHGRCRASGTRSSWTVSP
jgi:aerobic carbon-monoxide dehydrogenase large subunit